MRTLINMTSCSNSWSWLSRSCIINTSSWRSIPKGCV